MFPSVSPTKSVVPVSILQVCKHRVSGVVTQEELERHAVSREELVERIADIVSRNLASGRAQRVFGEGEPGRILSLTPPPGARLPAGPRPPRGARAPSCRGRG